MIGYRTPVGTLLPKPFIGAAVFNRITRVAHPAGSISFYGWEWIEGELYAWVSVW